ncbi:hypothetical protein KM043_006467 [Ampulex compressa]|nr:hypothetical protein KM043_006467 [Ampulex compressa]
MFWLVHKNYWIKSKPGQEKIIDADIKLKEASMQLESLELANKEMEDVENNLGDTTLRCAESRFHSLQLSNVLGENSTIDEGGVKFKTVQRSGGQIGGNVRGANRSAFNVERVSE